MNNKLSVLVLDDDMNIQLSLESYLETDFTVYLASTPSEAFDILEKENIDLLISDIQLPEMTGLDLLGEVKDQYPDVETIMISGYGDMDKAIEAMRKGAIDFFNKPIDPSQLKLSLERTRKFIEMEQELRKQKNIALLSETRDVDKSGVGILGEDEKIRELKETIHKVAQTPDTSVLITGESGTGKELVARGIHNLSSRSDQYFAAVNVSAVNRNLFESEFFGHRKGAFTGADDNQTGWFDIANKGTLFLDEIGEIPPEIQVKLLRTIEEKKYTPVGSQKEKDLDIRFISATNKDIEESLREGSLREDLFYRLARFIIHVPPLRERKEDIPLLADYFVKFFNKKLGKNIKKIPPEALDLLMSYDFPGNVRNLRNLLERAVILCEDNVLRKDCLPHIFGENQKDISQKQSEEIFDLEEIEKRTIIQALERVNYNKSRAAELLNIKWNALDRRMDKYGIKNKQG